MAQVRASLQPLIDSRLDTIDRMLLGRLPRAERLEIVHEVESQIFELLTERVGESSEPTREDILAVLARLDPPEAYMPDETGHPPAPPRGASQLRVAGHPWPTLARNPVTPAARASPIVGLAVLLLLLIMFPLTIGIANVFPGNAVVILTFWYGLTLIGFAGSITAVSLAATTRLRGSWGIAGLVIGIFGLLGSLGFAVLGLML
jgi:hypothetical protein